MQQLGWWSLYGDLGLWCGLLGGAAVLVLGSVAEVLLGATVLSFVVAPGTTTPCALGAIWRPVSN